MHRSQFYWAINNLYYSIFEWIERTELGPFYLNGLTIIWISDYFHHNVWGVITYPFPDINGAAVEVWEWMNKFVAHFIDMWLHIHFGISINLC